MTVSGIIGAIAVDAEDRLILGDLRQKRRKGRRITDGVGRDLDCPDIQGLRIDPDMNLAPLAAIGSAVLPCFPFAFAHHLDPVLSTSRPELGRPPRSTGKAF